MPRTARKTGDNGVYHIVMRGINKQTVFYDENDGAIFLNRLIRLKGELDFEIFAFCLMNNHAHLLIKEPPPILDESGQLQPSPNNVGKIIHKLLTSYVQWYNKKYGRVGHLFQNRFSSEPIDTDEYLLACMRYIHQNPLKANPTLNLTDYAWSSYPAYISSSPTFLDTGFVLEMLGGTDEFIKFHSTTEDKKFIDIALYEKLTDIKVADKVKELFGVDNLYSLNSGDYMERDANIERLLTIKGANLAQLARVTGISIYAINDYIRRNNIER